LYMLEWKTSSILIVWFVKSGSEPATAAIAP
jgi:hypothetical protein